MKDTLEASSSDSAFDCGCRWISTDHNPNEYYRVYCELHEEMLNIQDAIVMDDEMCHRYRIWANRLAADVVDAND
jgi:hypothetical protein